MTGNDRTSTDGRWPERNERNERATRIEARGEADAYEQQGSGGEQRGQGRGVYIVYQISSYIVYCEAYPSAVTRHLALLLRAKAGGGCFSSLPSFFVVAVAAITKDCPFDSVPLMALMASAASSQTGASPSTTTTLLQLQHSYTGRGPWNSELNHRE